MGGKARIYYAGAPCFQYFDYFFKSLATSFHFCYTYFVKTIRTCFLLCLVYLVFHYSSSLIFSQPDS